MTIKHDPRAEGNPSADVLPPEAPRMPPAPAIKPDLDALELHRISSMDRDDLEDLTLAELYARSFDNHEEDPAQSVALLLADEMIVLGTAIDSSVPPSNEVLDRVFFRASNFARLAAELHRRQREALLEALAQQGGPR